MNFLEKDLLRNNKLKEKEKKPRKLKMNELFVINKNNKKKKIKKTKYRK